ncbi:MAG: MFS transporter [Zoogloea sp.]|nr:MFS transporter [Zoogloea sp.]
MPDLLCRRRFGPLFLTQFLGALNDNLFKNALVILATFHAAQFSSLSSGVLVNLAAGLFILPFFIFSASSGQLADKFDKADIARLVKIAEIVIMAAGAAGLVFSSLPLLLGALCMMGLHSTVFGPVKYAILPQHLASGELLAGNAWMEGGTFVAILLGTVLGGVITAGGGDGPRLVAGTCLAIAVAGYIASRFIPKAPSAVPELRLNPNPFRETLRNLRMARENPLVFRAIVAISWFWFFGALFLTQFPAYAKDWLGGSEGMVTMLLATFSVGIGLGSAACALTAHRFSGPRIAIWGGIMMSLFAIDLWLASPAHSANAPGTIADLLSRPGNWRILADLLLISVGGGLFAVPLYTLVQSCGEVSHRARLIATINILNALFMVGAAAFAIGALTAGFSVPQLFLATGLLNAGFLAWLAWREPVFRPAGGVSPG